MTNTYNSMGTKVIRIENLTKDYGCGRGVFDISINVAKGECYGFLGPNGAGKTTTIRHLMGFSKPDMGNTFINDMDSWKNAAVLKHQIGYLPGEITFPSGMTGSGFLNMMQKMHGCSNDHLCSSMLKRFDLDPNKKTVEMSLGEKRKLAIIAAFVHNPNILILDEPTSDLDPVMQQEFIDFISHEKECGKTIFLSSHIFSEIDAVCDRISIIKSGKIVSEFKAKDLKNSYNAVYSVKFADKISYDKFKALGYTIASDSDERLKLKVRVPEYMMNNFVNDMALLNLKEFHQVPFSLEDYFMEFYVAEAKYE